MPFAKDGGGNQCIKINSNQPIVWQAHNAIGHSLVMSCPCVLNILGLDVSCIFREWMQMQILGTFLPATPTHKMPWPLYNLLHLLIIVYSAFKLLLIHLSAWGKVNKRETLPLLKGILWANCNFLTCFLSFKWQFNELKRSRTFVHLLAWIDFKPSVDNICNTLCNWRW